MKLKKILSFIFGSIMLFFSLILFSTREVSGCFQAVSFLFLALLIFPTFKFICKLVNKDFSLGRKIALGIGTFMAPSLLFSSEEVIMGHISALIFALIMFWVIMFATNKKQYIDVDERKILEKSKKTDVFHKLYNYIIEKRNAKVIAMLKYEEEIKKNFVDLDIMTVHAIAKMIGETNERQNTIFVQDMPNIRISDLIMAFCKDSQKIENEYELNILYTREYYKKIINKYCPELVKYIKDKIRESLPYQNKNRYVEFYNEYLNIFMSTMDSFASLKFYRTISSYGEEYDIDKNFDLESVDYRFKDAFMYLVDLLSTCTCISKMIFVERKVKKLNFKNEFYKIVSNMAKEINDVDLIIKKTRPIYDEFYKSELGFIDDELLYGIAIAKLSNRINNKPLSEKDENIVKISNKKYNNFEEFDVHMEKWICEISDKNRNLEINKYVIYKTTNSIDLKNFDLYFEALGKTNEYIKLYFVNVEHNNKKTDKDRYLKGNFGKEKEELSGKYSLNNITTGTQFELYLVNLFKDLGYKTKHNGKSGDQGADLILKKDNYVYAVQAKYYTGKLSNTPVQEITGALKYYNANQGVVVTNSSFTSGAKELAKANNIILIDGKDLKKLTDYAFDDNHEEDILKKFEK